MYSKIKTADTISKKFFVHICVAYIALVPISAIILMLNESRYSKTLAVEGVIFWFLISTRALIVAWNTLSIRSGKNHRVLGPWYYNWKSEHKKHKKNFSNDYSYNSSLSKWHPDYKKRKRIDPTGVGEYRIESFLRIVFFDSDDEKRKDESKFTLFCSPDNEYNAKKFGDLLLATEFDLPLKHKFDLVVIEENDSLWYLAAILET